MNLPESYTNLMGFVPEKARPMVEASMKLNAERQGALQQELTGRQAALEQQRAMKQEQLQKSFDELDQETKQFPAVQHDLKRQRIINDMRFEKFWCPEHYHEDMIQIYLMCNICPHSQKCLCEDSYCNISIEYKYT